MAQQDKLKSWIAETLPGTTRAVGAWIETECGVIYESRCGLIALLHRLGMEHRKPKAVSSKVDFEKQAAFMLPGFCDVWGRRLTVMTSGSNPDGVISKGSRLGAFGQRRPSPVDDKLTSGRGCGS
jgi:hypothetical protein